MSINEIVTDLSTGYLFSISRHIYVKKELGKIVARLVEENGNVTRVDHLLKNGCTDEVSGKGKTVTAAIRNMYQIIYPMEESNNAKNDA